MLTTLWDGAPMQIAAVVFIGLCVGLYWMVREARGANEDPAFPRFVDGQRLHRKDLTIDGDRVCLYWRRPGGRRERGPLFCESPSFQRFQAESLDEAVTKLTDMYREGY